LSVCVALALPSSGLAVARTIEPLQAEPPASPSPAGWFFRDRIINRPRPLAMAAVAAPRILTLHYVVGGQTVEIALSPSFADIPQNRAAARSLVNFLGSHIHGSELGRLRVFLGTSVEVSLLCGGGPEVLGCYSAAQHRMFVPDRESPGLGYTREYAMTHEYGHHIASLRSNAPWPALSYGAKYWASYERVCARAAQQQLFPGDEGAHYRENPGEGFADTYAHIYYPSVPFQFAPIMAPTPGSKAALRRDVVAPWRGPRRSTLRGLLGAGAPARAFVIRQSLDGFLSFRLLGPPGSNYDLQLVTRGRVVQSTTAPGSHDPLTVLGCRADAPTVTYTLRVLRRSGSGPFSVSAAVVG
jgi:hypothetical protein